MFIVVHVNLCAAVCFYDKDAISFYWSIIFHSGNKIDGRPVSQIEIFAIMRIRVMEYNLRAACNFPRLA